MRRGGSSVRAPARGGLLLRGMAVVVCKKGEWSVWCLKVVHRGDDWGCDARGHEVERLDVVASGETAVYTCLDFVVRDIFDVESRGEADTKGSSGVDEGCVECLGMRNKKGSQEE